MIALLVSVAQKQDLGSMRVRASSTLWVSSGFGDDSSSRGQGAVPAGTSGCSNLGGWK